MTIAGGSSGVGGTKGGDIEINAGADSTGAATYGTVKVGATSGVVTVSKAGAATAVEGSLTVNEATTLTTTLEVGGAVKVQGDVDVKAAATLDIGATMATGVNIGKSAGATSVLSTLAVKKKLTVETGGLEVLVGDVAIGGDSTAKSLTTTAQVVVGQSLEVSAGGMKTTGGIDLTAGGCEFPTASVGGSCINVKDAVVSALDLKQGTNSFLTLDTQNEKVLLGQTTVVNADLSTTSGGTGTGAFTSAGKLTASAGAKVSGGLDLSSSGLSLVGAVSGVTTLDMSGKATLGADLVVEGGMSCKNGINNNNGGMSQVGSLSDVTTLKTTSTVESGGKLTVNTGGVEITAGGLDVTGGIVVNSVGLNVKDKGITEAGDVSGVKKLTSSDVATIGGTLNAESDFVAKKQVVVTQMASLEAQDEITVLSEGSYALISDDASANSNKLAINDGVKGQIMLVTNNDGEDCITANSGVKFNVPAGKTVLYVYDGSAWNDITAIGMLKNPMEVSTL